MSTLPQFKPDSVPLAGGMDMVTSPMFAKPGSLRLAYNYEPAISGGMQRIGGLDLFDGQPSPSAATYVLLECAAAITAAAVGDTLTGQTTGATGEVIYVSGTRIAVTKLVGSFSSEVVKVGATTVGTVTDAQPSLDGFLDNTLSKAAADVYQADIGKVPGVSRIRGLAVLNDDLYAWRDGSNASTTFTVAATGEAPLTYQWERSDDAGSTWAEIAGETSTTYTFLNIQSTDNGARFRCHITNAAGDVYTAAATLTVI